MRSTTKCCASQMSAFCQKNIIKCPCVITADDAFPLGYHLMKPYGGRTQRVHLITDSHVQEE